MSLALWTAPLVVPLLLAIVALVVTPHRRPVAAIVAPVPALVLALAPEAGPAPDLGWLLLDVQLALDDPRRILLAAIALVWTGGATAARELLSSRVGTASVWLLALFGNLGVVLAGDIVTLYATFAVLSFAAYPLVVHERTASARRAGRIYLVMTLVGEALLLAGLMLAVSAVGSTGLPQLAEAVDQGVVGAPELGLMAAGFAVKVGILPVHLWLPLAHPAAPVPASAVLSGAIIKAGIAGWLHVLPVGRTPSPSIGGALVLIGLATILLAGLVGVVQLDAKVVLAYSSVSQMGFIAVIVGAGLMGSASGSTAALAASVYVLHHGLAKATLFLSVRVRDQLPTSVVLVGSALAGLALAGAPLTSGFVAKLAAKDVVSALPTTMADRVTLTLTFGAVVTTLLVARFLSLLLRDARAAAPRPGTGTSAGAVVAWAGLLAGVAVASFVLPGVVAETWVTPGASLGDVVSATWPVLLGSGIAVLAARVPRLAMDADRPLIPPGDALVLVQRVGQLMTGPVDRASAGWSVVVRRVTHSGQVLRERVDPIEALGRLDDTLTRWRPFGIGFVAVAVLIAWSLTT